MFKFIFDISRPVQLETQADSEDPNNFSVSDMVCYEYARQVSYDVEVDFLSMHYSSVITDTKLTYITLC